MEAVRDDGRRSGAAARVHLPDRISPMVVAEEASDLKLTDASMQCQMFAPFRTSPSQNPRLRIGILLDGPKLSAFFARIIEDIQASNFARIELLVYRKKPAQAQEQSKSRLGA